FKSEITPRELADVYTPSPEEQAFARRQGRTLQGRLAILVLVKTAQRLGYFVKLAEVPPSIVCHIATCLVTKPLTKIEMRDFDLDSERQRQRLLEQVRRFLGIQAVTGATTGVIESAAREAAQTKHELADIINVVIEQLVRQRFELPGFSTLLRTARRIRAQVNDETFNLLSGALSPALKHEIDDLFMVKAGDTSGWRRIKREPKKPTNPEVRAYLEHLAWLKAWVARLPAIDHIAAPKFHQYMLEARALDAADIKATKPAKRYALAVVSHQPTVIVVGAGLAGLTCAYRLSAHAVDVILLEAQARVGGRCWSSTGWRDGQVAEHGGEHIEEGQEHILNLIGQLGLDLRTAPRKLAMVCCGSADNRCPHQLSRDCLRSSRSCVASLT
ncbi:MAG: FAD-dependent oxidoreductase, partial [Candidatus Nanopelagicales bacterium]